MLGDFHVGMSEMIMNLNPGPRKRFLPAPAIFVKPLTSESPTVKDDGGMMMPTLEKLLVDINADKDYFYLQGEAFYIFQNAIERYNINEKRLLRYARRRSLESKIKRFLEKSI